MDAFFDGLDCRLRVSGMLADSIMMGIVNSAMEDAYKKSCSKEGDLERLYEKCRFCELATMQLEWCLKFLQEEMDNSVIDSTHDREKLLSDLLETRDRIHNRLEETELAITEKDMELMERKESLSKLRITLEEKDDDISSLHSALLIAKVEGERVKRCVPLTKPIVKNNDDYTLHEWKNDIDQHVKKIRRKLKDGQQKLAIFTQNLNANLSGRKNLESGVDVDDEDPKQTTDEALSYGGDLFNNFLIEQLRTKFEEMDADVDALREKLSSSFQMMETSDSIFKSELAEQQWAWRVEKDMIYFIIRSFLRGMQHETYFKPDFRGENFLLPLLNMSWLDFMNDIRSLHSELDMFVSQTDVQPKTDSKMELRTHNNPPLRLTVGGKNSERNTSSGSRNYLEKSASVGASMSKDEDFSDSNADVPSEENPSGQSVTKMIGTHEHIIRRKSEEFNWIKKELLEETSSSILSNDTSLCSLKETTARVIKRLEGIIKERGKLVSFFENRRRISGRDDDNLGNILFGFRFVEEPLSSREFPEQSSNRLCCQFTIINDELQRLKQEAEDLDTYIMILEENYAILMKGLLRNLHLEFIDRDLDTLVREDMFEVMFTEIVKEWNNENESCNTERLLRNNIHHIVITEAIQDIKDVYSTPGQEEDLSSGNNLSQSFLISERMGSIQEVDSLSNYCSLEAHLREGTNKVILDDMVKELNDEKQACDIERELMADIYRTIFTEVVKDIRSIVSLSQYRSENEELSSDNQLCQSSVISETMNPMQELDSLLSYYDEETQIREAINIVIFNGMIKELGDEKETCDIERILTEDIFHILFTEIVKEIRSTLNPTSMRCQEKDLPVGDSLCRSPETSKMMDLIQEVTSLLAQPNGEGTLVHNPYSQFTVNCSHFVLVGYELEESRQLFAEKEDARLPSRKVENGLQKGVSVKTRLRELAPSLGISLNGMDMVYDLVTSGYGIKQDGSQYICLPTGHEERQSRGLQFVMIQLIDLSLAIMGFDHLASGKIRECMSRLNNLNYNFLSLMEQVKSIMGSELLFRKAFKRRCCDLQTAETEVDLLGDQVDHLLGLMEKIYIELDYYSPVLEHYPGIMNVLRSLQNELHGEVICASSQ